MIFLLPKPPELGLDEGAGESPVSTCAVQLLCPAAASGFGAAMCWVVGPPSRNKRTGQYLLHFAGKSWGTYRKVELAEWAFEGPKGPAPPPTAFFPAVSPLPSYKAAQTLFGVFGSGWGGRKMGRVIFVKIWILIKETGEESSDL